MGDKKSSRLGIREGKGSRAASEEVKTVAPLTGSGSGSGSASAVDEVSVKAAPAVAEVPGVGNDPPSATDLILKRLRAVQKKIRDVTNTQAKEAAGQAINEDQKKKLELKPALLMVEQELKNILLMLSSEKPISQGHHHDSKQSSPPKMPPPPGPDQVSSMNLTGSSTTADPVDPVPPLSKVEEWQKKEKGGKLLDYKQVTMAHQDAEIADIHFKKFLATYPVGAPKSYYHSQFSAMVEDSGPNVLLVPYEHLRRYSSNLAMGVCSHFKRLKIHLTRAARKHMLESFPEKAELAKKLGLKFLELPVSHQKFELFLDSITLLEEIKVFDEVRSTATPTPAAASVVQNILWGMMKTHKRGFSWNGEFGISDIEVFNGRTFVFCKSPQRFGDPNALFRAATKDFLCFAESILSKLSSVKYFVPFFKEFDHMLRNMGQFPSLYSNAALGENLRDLVLHHPFLKPPIVTASFLSGVHKSCSSYDIGDANAVFKASLRNIGTGNQGWMEDVRQSGNSMLSEVLLFKRKMTEQNEFRRSRIQKDKLLDSEEFDLLVGKSDYRTDLESFVEFIRHLFEHGKDKTKEKQRLLLGKDGRVADSHQKPRKQYMQSIEETLLAAVIHVDRYIVETFITLVTTDSFKGMLLPFWKAYKNSSSCSSSHFLEDPMLEQALLYQQEEDVNQFYTS